MRNQYGNECFVQISDGGKTSGGDPDEMALAAVIRQRRQPTEGGIGKRIAEATEMPAKIFDQREPLMQPRRLPLCWDANTTQRPPPIR